MIKQPRTVTQLGLQRSILTTDEHNEAQICRGNLASVRLGSNRKSVRNQAIGELAVAVMREIGMVYSEGSRCACFIFPYQFPNDRTLQGRYRARWAELSIPMI
jgi:hypothetical protein